MNCDRATLPLLRLRRGWVWVLWVALGLALFTGARIPAATPTAGAYETGYADLVRIAADLHRTLEPARRPQVHPVPLLRKETTAPFIQPCLHREGAETRGAVEVSPGFVVLLNYVSHAKAIDGVDRGFYRESIASLAATSGETGLPWLRNSHRKAWAFKTMNHQVSHFNQMAAALLAIEMAHHYLGHFEKYAGHLSDAQGRPVPINSRLAPEEWHAAVVAGVKHALRCGFGVDGLKSLCEGIDRMPVRPAWTLYLVPPTTPLGQMSQSLSRTEHDFFLASDYAP